MEQQRRLKLAWNIEPCGGHTSDWNYINTERNLPKHTSKRIEYSREASPGLRPTFIGATISSAIGFLPNITDGATNEYPCKEEDKLSDAKQTRVFV